MGNIKWSPLSVSQAMDRVETEVEGIFEPLWRAEAIVRDTIKLPHLPGYMEGRLLGLSAEIRRITGSNLKKEDSRLLECIQWVRRDLPQGAAEAEGKTAQHGKTQGLFAW